MSTALDITREVRVRKEASFGVAPGATGARIVRRTQFAGGLTKQPFQSQEIRPDYQIADVRHGMRGVAATLSGELSPGSHQEFFENILRRNYATAPTSGALTNVTAAAAGRTFTRAAGSWITDGFRVGMVARVSGFLAPALANNRDYRITALTATVMTVAEVVVDRAAGDSVTVTLAGRHTFVPMTGHTNESLYLEDWNPGAPLSERMAGCRVNQVGISIPPSDMARLQIGLVGQDATADTTAYFTTPAAPSTTPIVAGPTGQIRLGSADIAVVTGGSLQIAAALGTQDVIGSTVTPDIYPAPVVVTGELSIIVQDEVEWNRFSAETEFAVWLKLNASTDPLAPFLSFYMARCKYVGRATAPQNGSIVQTLPFQALLANVATGTEQTTILMQDSGAV
jgi:hypothetical protein